MPVNCVENFLWLNCPHGLVNTPFWIIDSLLTSLNAVL